MVIINLNHPKIPVYSLHTHGVDLANQKDMQLHNRLHQCKWPTHVVHKVLAWIVHNSCLLYNTTHLGRDPEFHKLTIQEFTNYLVDQLLFDAALGTHSHGYK